MINERLVDKVVGVLSSYEEVECDRLEVLKNFDIIQSLFNEYGVDVTKNDYQIENLYIKYDFIGKSQSALKKAIKFDMDIKLRLNACSLRTYINYGKNCISIEVPRLKKQIASVKELLSQPIENERENGLYALFGKANQKALPWGPT